MLDKYVEINEFEKIKKIDSPLYGKYNAVRICTIDFISACLNGDLEEVHDFYSKLREDMYSFSTNKIKSMQFGRTTLHKFEVYIPTLEVNQNWKDPKGNLDQLPIAFKEKDLMEIINSKL